MPNTTVLTMKYRQWKHILVLKDKTKQSHDYDKVHGWFYLNPLNIFPRIGRGQKCLMADYCSAIFVSEFFNQNFELLQSFFFNK